MASSPAGNLSDTPCSGCGRSEVLFSNRQMKLDPAKRRCLECMPNHGAVLPTEPTDKEASDRVPGGVDAPKPCLADEPCSACGQLGVLFSKRQMKVDPSKRRCLDCMPGGSGAAAAPGAVQLPVEMPQPQQTVAAAAGGGCDPVKPCTAPEPCSACGRLGVLFSKRQMKIDAVQRKCLECMQQPAAAPAAVCPRISPLAAAPRLPFASPMQGRFALPAARPAANRLAMPAMRPAAAALRPVAPRVPFVPSRPAAANPFVAPLRRPPVVPFRPAAPLRPAAPPLLAVRQAAAPAPQVPGASQGMDAPKPTVAPEPCSQCGRVNALYSKRQMKVDPATRRCLECMGGPGAEAEAMVKAANAPDPQELAEANMPKPTQSAEPCSGCGRCDMFYSKRQIKVDASKRKCLDCMPAAIASAQPPQLSAQPSPPAAAASRKRSASEAGLNSPAGTGFVSQPVENLSIEPCSACGRAGMTFSNRQMKVDAKKRRCIECMPVSGAGGPKDEVAAILASEVELALGSGAGNAGKGLDLPKENIAEEPCSQCGRQGVPFSNRQMKVAPGTRRCLECMGGRAAA